MSDSSLLPLTGHQADPGCFREVPVSTGTSSPFLYSLFGGHEERGQVEQGWRGRICEATHSPISVKLLIYWPLARVFFTTNKPSLEILLSCKPGKMILFSFPF